MNHDFIGASRRVARIVGALSAPFLAVIGGSLPSPASAGSGGVEHQFQMPGSYCDGSGQELTPGRVGCARIKGYIAAGARFGSDDRIGGRLNPFGSIDEPGIAAARSSSGLVIIGAPLGGDSFFAPTSKGDIAR